MSSPIEAMPYEILNKIFGWLKKSPWKLPLGQSSKTLYEVFKSHIERRKADLLKDNSFLLWYAAAWGDPILTRIPFDPDKFHSGMFSSLCLSGNVALVKYVDAYLFLSRNDFTSVGDHDTYRSLGYRYRKAITELLRSMTFKTNDEFISQKIVDEILSYFFEGMSTKFKEAFFRAIAGILEVHGQNTCIYTAFKEYVDCLESQSSHNYRLKVVRKAIILESYLAGVNKIPNYNWIFEVTPRSCWDWNELYEFLNTCVRRALSSPYENEEAIRKAWNNYTTTLAPKTVVPRHIETYFSIAATTRKMSILSDIVEKYVAIHDIHIDYYKVWLKNHHTSLEHMKCWDLDPKTCLIRHLSRCGKCIISSHSMKMNTLRRLMKYYPNILHSLTSEEREEYQYLGLFCPRCLNITIKCEEGQRGPYRCEYCTLSFPSEGIHE